MALNHKKVLIVAGIMISAYALYRFRDGSRSESSSSEVMPSSVVMRISQPIPPISNPFGGLVKGFVLVVLLLFGAKHLRSMRSPSVVQNLHKLQSADVVRTDFSATTPSNVLDASFT